MITEEHFESCRIGPAGLRPLLKRVRMPGERLVGWGVVHKAPGLVRSVGVAAMQLLPGIGQLAAAGMVRGEVRVCVLTDTRLVLLVGRGNRVGEATPDTVLVHEPITRLSVEVLGHRRFAMKIPRWPVPRMYSVVGQEGSPADRLMHGLTIVAAGPIRQREREALRTRPGRLHVGELESLIGDSR